jgi:aminomethyltransferase
VRTSPLDARHRALGAKMAPFGGWEMPIHYRGVLDEHRACREDAAVFDVSHLGTVECSGPDAYATLQALLTNDLDRIAPGRAQYTHLLDPDDAHVVDDIIVWWVEPERFFVMPNASNTDRLLDALSGTDATDITSGRAVLAVQGPNARAKLAAVSAEAAAVGRFDVRPVGRWTVAGTGYTGEDGVEIHVAAEDAPALWDLFMGADIVPAGLGARDTLRLEAGLPLHGHELGPGITPLQARLGWVVRWDKGPFRGRDALAREKDAGPHRLLAGLAFAGRQPGREGAVVYRDGQEVGVVTSGNFSPTLGHAIAFAFVPPSFAPGDAVEVDVRGKRLPATVVKTPFVTR